MAFELKHSNLVQQNIEGWKKLGSETKIRIT